VPRRCSLAVLALTLACVRGTTSPSPHADAADLLPAPERITAADLTALRAAISGRADLYWRLRGPDGARCEAWTLAPDPDDPNRGQLVHVVGELRLRFAYELVDDQLRLHTPEREREHTAPDGLVSATAVALPCVFSGMSFTPDDRAAAPRVALTGHERWFLDPQACAAAGPDVDPQPPAAGELHPLGCPAALADPGTRARDEPPPAPMSPAARRLQASHRVYWLRSRAGRSVCEPWQHTSDRDRIGTLTRHERGQHGPATTTYGYVAATDALTLLGPSERRRLADGELARARGCLLTRPLALAGDALQVGADRWYLRRRACEAARRAGVLPQPDPDCGPALKSESSAPAPLPVH
jgi:hypothetical protein